MSAENNPSAKELPVIKCELMAAFPYDRRVKRKHALVYNYVLQYFHAQYGDALLSARHIAAALKERDPSGEGLSIGQVQVVLTDLLDWRYLRRTFTGKGRSASRYIPAWIPFSVLNGGDATDLEPSVSNGGDAAVSNGGDANADSVPNGGNKDTLTGHVYQTRVPESVIDPAPPSAPAAAGACSPATPEAAGGGFEALWRVYGYNKNFPEARAAYDKLAPDADLHAAMIRAATAWREAWAAQGKADARRMELAKWIERQEYRCDPPTGYRPKQRRAGSVAAAPPANDNAAPSGPVWHTLPDGERDARIVTTSTMEIGPSQYLTLHFGAGMHHEFPLRHADISEQKRGQRLLEQIAEAAGVVNLDDDEQLRGRWVRMKVKGDVVQYSAISERAA